MRKLKSFLLTVILAGITLFSLTLVGCTANSITGAQPENPAAVQSTPNGPSGSSAGTTYDYNGADVDDKSSDLNESSEEDEPKLSTDPRSDYNT